MIARLIDRLSRRAPQDRGLRLGVTLGLVAGSVAIRLLLQPVFQHGHAYAAFYPAVILAVFLAGRREGLLATALSAAAAYWLFEPPARELKLNPVAAAQLLFFVVNTGAVVLLVAGLKEALVRGAREQGRAEAEAQHNADLFRELNERMGHHLQLVAGVLALQSAGEPDAKVAEALAGASEASLLLARAHRDFTGRTEERVEFLPFARRLVDSELASRGLPPQSIGLSGDGLELPPDQATLLGAALLECLGVLIGRRAPMARLDLEFRRRGRGVALRVAEIDDPNDGALEHLAEGRLLRAVIEQLGARLVYAGDEQGGALEIHFQPGGHAAASLAQQVTLH